MSAGNIGEKCDDQNSSAEEDSPDGTLVDQEGQKIDVELSSHSSDDNSCQKRKKKTPQQYRKEKPKKKHGKRKNIYE